MTITNNETGLMITFIKLIGQFRNNETSLMEHLSNKSSMYVSLVNIL